VDTDVNYDRSWSFHDGMSGRLREGFNRGEEVLQVTTYLKFCCELHDLPHLFKPLISGALRDTERSGVKDTAEILVQVLCEMVHVPLVESLYEIVYELELRGYGACWVRHLGEAIEGGGPI
jgi:hypothetical protein